MCVVCETDIVCVNVRICKDVRVVCMWFCVLVWCCICICLRCVYVLHDVKACGTVGVYVKICGACVCECVVVSVPMLQGYLSRAGELTEAEVP